MPQLTGKLNLPMRLHQIRPRRRRKSQPHGPARKREQQNPLQGIRPEPLEDPGAVLLRYLPVEAQTLDPSLLEPGRGDVQREPPR